MTEPKAEETLAELEAKLLIKLAGEPPEIIEEELVELRGKWETDHPKPKKAKAARTSVSASTPSKPTKR